MKRFQQFVRVTLLLGMAIALCMYAPSPRKHQTPFTYWLYFKHGMIRRAMAFTGCNNLTLATGWTCIDSFAISGSGSNPETLSLNNNNAVHQGDILITWANMVTSSYTTQTIAITDNITGCGVADNLAEWSLGNNSYSNPANQWVGAWFFGIACAAKASGYQGTCTVTLHGGATATCDDYSLSIIRPPSPATVLTEETSISNWQHPANTGAGSPSLVISPNGQSITTVNADLVVCGGNSDQSSDTITSPFTGTDGDGVTNVAFYYTNMYVQSVAGMGNCKWTITAQSTAAGSGIFALTLGGGATASFSPTFLNYSPQQAGLGSTHQSFTLTNTGSSAMTITSIALSGANAATDYSQTNNCPVTLNASSSCTITVYFAATAVGARTASVTFTDSATGSPQTVTLYGTGFSGSIGVF